MSGTCHKSWEEHYSDVMEAFTNGNAGGACEETYQALVEIAEMLRRVHGHATHQVDEERVEGRVREVLAYRESVLGRPEASKVTWH